MSATIISLLSGIAAVVGGFLALKTNPNRLRRQAEDDVRNAANKKEAMKQEIREAVYSQDDDKLNRLVAKLLAGLLLAAVLVGCATRPQIVYIPTDRRIVSITNEYGVACKAVPDAVFVEMLDKIVELDDLKTAQAVDHRLSTPAK